MRRRINGQKRGKEIIKQRRTRNRGKERKKGRKETEEEEK